MSKLDEWNEDELGEVARGIRWIHEYGWGAASLKYQLVMKRFMTDFDPLSTEVRKQDEEKEKDNPEEV